MDITRTVTVGRVVLTLGREYDDCSDASWLGKFSEYREPVDWSQKLVHRDTGLVLDHHGIWRDGKGRASREYEFTFHDNGHERLAYALQDSKRLESLNRGDICFLGVIVKVRLNGAEIGYGAL